MVTPAVNDAAAPLPGPDVAPAPLPLEPEPLLPPPAGGQAPAQASLPPDVLQLQAQAAEAGKLRQQLADNQTQLAQQQAQAAYQEQRNMEAEAVNWAAQQARAAVPQMVATGNWTQEQAEIAASAHYRGEAEKALRQFQQQQQAQQQKNYAIQELSRLTGMPPAMLQGYNDWNSMVAAARQYMTTVGPQQQELRKLQEQVQALTARQVPVQTYAQPGRTAGQAVANTDNIDALYVGWDDAHPGQQGNPYEAQYRKFIGF